MLSGVFEVLMALALVLSSLLYVDIFSITTNDKKEERIIVLDGPLLSSLICSCCVCGRMRL